MAYTFKNLIVDVLEHFKKPLTRAEIWREGEKLGLAEKIGSKGKTPIMSVSTQLYVDLKNNKNTLFYKTSERPYKFGLKKYKRVAKAEEQSILDAADNEQQPMPEVSKKESDLHRLLAAFVKENERFLCYTKTIRHETSKRSSKQGLNQWLHPDMVGVYFPYEYYNPLTLTLLDAVKENSYKIFSFELKLKISFGNMRQCYFQALSNSGWAHEGYLVTLDIEDDDEDLLSEIGRLNNAFGIGLIKLDPVNIEQSEVKFPSHKRDSLDWQTVDRLITENKSFRELLIEVTDDIGGRKVRGKYDTVYTPEEIAIFSKKQGFIPE